MLGYLSFKDTNAHILSIWSKKNIKQADFLQILSQNHASPKREISPKF